MAIFMRAKKLFSTSLRSFTRFQRWNHTLGERSLQVDTSKWKKIQASKVGISASMISHPSWVVLNILHKGGFEAYLVGGCVRDLLLNRIPKDFDVITTANLKQIRSRFHRAVIIGRRFPICRVQIKGSIIEVSSFETVAKHDEEKEKTLPSLVPNRCDEKDLIRWRNSRNRDFTINSLFFDPFTSNIYDYNDGMSDLKLLKLRTLIPAHVSFQEDCARILRGLRIAARLCLSFSRDIERAMHDLSASIGGLDKFRLMLEINYMLSYGAAVPSICLLQRFNLLNILLPFQAAYIDQQRSAKNSMMLMKLFFNLDKLVSCDHPADSNLW
ncbi:putative plant ubiquilin [Hibiscus syriacus]|uniref:Plant ubiquilin n=1 Tax=Hibiscus syriacus TaxID=106335 RepID=A0A6A2Z2J7_HIBSY|nr:putative plant ubiquilin [Hibiscus syriacus]